MKKILISLLFVLFCSNSALADKVCSKITKDRLGRIVTSYRTVLSTVNCPRGFKLVIDTAPLVSLAQQPQGQINLPSGQLMVGGYGGFFTATAPSQYLTDTQTFPFKVNFPLTTNFIEDGAASTANCPGTEEAPDAAAGHLCVYERYNGANGNRAFQSIYNTFNGGFTDFSSAFTIYFSSNGAGDVVSYGSYAVRAP